MAFEYLDAAQLLKHAFGLVTAARRRNLAPALFYIYAEPAMRDGKTIDPEAVDAHRREADLFKKSVADDEVSFGHTSYCDWLQTWSEANPSLMAHRDLVLSRFEP